MFDLDKRFAAVLGPGGAICGVSAAIAIGRAVKAKKEHVSVAIALVTIWAIVIIFFIPLFSRLLNLHPANVGAWVGSSEFADAAGYAAAEAYGSMVGNMVEANCMYFHNNPQWPEKALPGLNALSSAYGCARGEAGICTKRDLYLSPVSKCKDFVSGRTNLQ